MTHMKESEITNNDFDIQGFGRSVLIVEDDALLRELIAQTLEVRGFRVETAATAADARRAFARGDHDAAILDVNLGPGPNGFDLADSLLKTSPNLAIVFLTNLPDSRFVGRNPKQIPKGTTYLRKSSLSEVDTLVTALDSALRGSRSQEFRQDQDPDRPLAQLTQKQMDVLRLASLGMSNAQIAQERAVSIKAIEDTLARAAAALDIDTEKEANIRVAAVRRYLAVTKGDPTRLSEGGMSIE